MRASSWQVYKVHKRLTTTEEELLLDRRLWDMDMVQKVIRDKASDADTDDSDEEYFVTPVILYLYDTL